MTLPFVKMHGIGNDFVVIDDLSRGTRSQVTPELARAMLNRHFGIGGDQLLWLKPACDPANHARMEIFNPDGSEAEMCGNGIRAVALLMARTRGRDSSRDEFRPEYKIETLGGIKTVRVSGDQVTVDMGEPKLGAPNGETLSVRNREILFFEANMGNPHAVIFVEKRGEYPVAEFGPAIENHERFPKRTNVEFVRVTGASSIQVDVWERGAGQTLACGTGACASAVAALATGRVKGDVAVELPGGALQIRWEGAGKPVFMTGPAVEVYRGEWGIS